MHNPIDPGRMSADDEPDARFEAALGEAFGPPSTAAGGRRCALEAIRESTGVTPRVLLRGDPSDDRIPERTDLPHIRGEVMRQRTISRSITAVLIVFIGGCLRAC
jgi:hypothetical protein